MLKKQKFGVEIEMTGITRAMAAKVVASVLNTRSSAAQGNVYNT
ncbi:MAG: amidoligase family protein, partial [Lacrimispora sphenoides]